MVMKTPRSVDIDITNKCNLRCKHCYHFNSPNDVKIDLPKTEWLKFFEELNRCQVMNVTFAGGEPFCREDFIDILEGLIENRMRFSILTNGTLISDELASFISSTNRCDSIQVSIDGSTSETHDVLRGKGSFERSIEGIKCLSRYGLPVTSRITVNRTNLNDLENIAHLLFTELGLKSISTNSAFCMGLGVENAEEILLSAQERSQAIEKLLKLNERYGGRINAMAGPLAEGTMWREMEKARSMKLASIDNRGSLVGCGCIFNKIAVRADGTIVPCTLLSHMELGKINQDSLREIWQHHPELKKLRDRCHIALSDLEFCRGCHYIPYCTGNCPATAYALHGETNYPSPEGCFKRFLEAGGRLPAGADTC
ncbi:MAG: SynChlorMet cassette radical SAM/SPASM protein ScmE [Methanotrichaceae archaeon]|nr:SynChlorMet cassette radical SAM/SPASM protein ScmE [Methanotrichaceae archaeon]